MGRIIPENTSLTARDAGNAAGNLQPHETNHSRLTSRTNYLFKSTDLCSWKILGEFFVSRSCLSQKWNEARCINWCFIRVPFQPSSCLSDKEEDEIYGFAGYGVYGKQMMQRQQQQRMMLAQAQANLPNSYQTCLSPRSAYFYEFPPTGKSEHNLDEKLWISSKLTWVWI